MEHQAVNRHGSSVVYPTERELSSCDSCDEKNDRHSLVILMLLYLAAAVISAVVNTYYDAPFVLWFDDTLVLLVVMLIYLGAVGVLWDGVLLTVGMLNRVGQRWRLLDRRAVALFEAAQQRRFFGRHLWLPLLQLQITAVAILGTSNITLLNLKLLGTVTEWRDPLLWGIEGEMIVWLTGFSINTAKWDLLYHSAWSIELFAAFLLLVLGRQGKIFRDYCLSMILLFYIGRFIGVFNPVMGPAFFHPELFSYLHGSVTDMTMQMVSGVFALGPENAQKQGGILLGGVSAMPSLHVGMVTLTAYWLAVARRWTLWLTIPWVVLVWSSTVLLGWHYLMDGASGMVLAAFCIGLTRRMVRSSGKLTSSVESTTDDAVSGR